MSLQNLKCQYLVYFVISNQLWMNINTLHCGDMMQEGIVILKYKQLILFPKSKLANHNMAVW